MAKAEPPVDTTAQSKRIHRKRKRSLRTMVHVRLMPRPSSLRVGPDARTQQRFPAAPWVLFRPQLREKTRAAIAQGSPVRSANRSRAGDFQSARFPPNSKAGSQE